jgi:transcriptional regulator with XRE-family HTH domain
MLIGDEIKRRREGIGMSQADFAKSVGLSQASLSRIERGQQKQSLQVGAIAAKLGCAVIDLDPDFSMPSDTVERESEPLSDQTTVLLSRIANRMSNELGFTPTDEQVVRHLVAKTPYRDLLS